MGGAFGHARGAHAGVLPSAFALGSQALLATNFPAVLAIGNKYSPSMAKGYCFASPDPRPTIRCWRFVLPSTPQIESRKSKITHGKCLRHPWLRKVLFLYLNECTS